MSFIKLKDVESFTVKTMDNGSFQKWDEDEGKMLKSPTYIDGFRKVYQVEVEEGTLTLSSAQVGQMMAGIVKDGKADSLGREFKVKTNGKSGMEIRYFINPVYKETPKAPAEMSELTGAIQYESQTKIEDTPFG